MSQTTASRPALRVALADDAALFRQGLALLLAEAGFTVSARVGDAQALLAAVRTGARGAVVMAEGRSNQAICRRLFLSPKTVETYVRSVFTKLGLTAGPDDNRRVLAVLTFLRS